MVPGWTIHGKRCSCTKHTRELEMPVEINGMCVSDKKKKKNRKLPYSSDTSRPYLYSKATLKFCFLPCPPFIEGQNKKASCQQPIWSTSRWHPKYFKVHFPPRMCELEDPLYTHWKQDAKKKKKTGEKIKAFFFCFTKKMPSNLCAIIKRYSLNPTRTAQLWSIHCAVTDTTGKMF